MMFKCLALLISLLMVACCPAHGKENFFVLNDSSFNYQSLIYYYPSIESNPSVKKVSFTIPVQEILGRFLSNDITPESILLLDKEGQYHDFYITRKREVLKPTAILKKDDTFISYFTSPKNVDYCDVLVLLISQQKDNGLDNYKLLDTSDMVPQINFDSNDITYGLVDCTGVIDLNKPAPLIQMDQIYSRRWGLWYEFASLKAVEKSSAQLSKSNASNLVPIPRNPLYLTAGKSKNKNATQFNMTDVPRFPLYYAKYYKATNDKYCLERLRSGLEAIIKYTREDGTMPYLLAPWNKKHRENISLFDTYHSMRAIAESLEIYKEDTEFSKRLNSTFKKLREFVYSHLDNGLFQGAATEYPGRPSANGALIGAFQAHYNATNNPQDIKDIVSFADAICTTYGRKHKADFGEYIPWVPIGLAISYQITGDEKYKNEYQQWIKYPILPSLAKDRRYYYPVPDFEASAILKPWGCNPLIVWYHCDMMMTIYEITKDERYIRLAGWILGDYYDRQRYQSTRHWYIIDTGNLYTDKWGAANAEDALRMMAKYLWQIKYPKLNDIIKNNKASLPETINKIIEHY